MTRSELLQIAKPILFNTEMVRVILEGKKTMTRRLVKVKSKNACGFYVTFRKSDNSFMGVYDYDENERMFDSSQTPPCVPGDILYVRETWLKTDCFGLQDGYFYKANETPSSKEVREEYGFKWRPSIHMPKEAARIFLRVADVRVERLQEIRMQDILAEGETPYVHLDDTLDEAATKTSFIGTWNATIKKSDLDRYGWDTNPWVWVIEFERVEVE